MVWHDGDVTSAVQEVKRTGATFLVYIQGSDEESTRMDAVWQSPSVTRALEGGAIVALKIAHNSPTCTQFNQFYPVIYVPSTFFIGDDGIPVEVVPGFCSEDDMAEKIRSALQAHHTKRSGAVSQVPPSSEQAEVPDAAAASASSSAAAVVESYADVAADVASSEERQENDAAGSSGEDIKQKLARARELLAQKQEERLQQQLEERRRKEEERRQLGKEMARLKQIQAEQNAREAAAEMRKDKEEEKIARQKVKDQIAKDRADRAERFQKEKDEKRLEAEQLAQQRLATQEEERARAAAARSNIARIQFRMADGSFLTHQFEPSDTLETARQYLALNAPSSLERDFRLSTSYPRRIFTAADMPSTLADLALVPSAVLVVLPPLTRGSSSSPQQQPLQQSSDSVWSWLQFVLAPLLALWSFIYTFLFGTGASAPGSRSAAPRQPVSSQGRTGSASSADDRRELGRGTRSTVRDGNIARLSSFEDNDDPNATWNGNSTQQK